MNEAIGKTHGVDVFVLQDDGTFPGNARCPVILIHGAFDFSPAERLEDRAKLVETTFERNGWSNGWRNGIYDFHHYHSTAHEVLGCCSGNVRVQLGGPSGPEVELHVGDVLLLSAGSSHRRVSASAELCIVGSYAQGRDYDMNRGHSGERPETDRNIAAVPLPPADPVLGAKGPLMRYWK